MSGYEKSPIADPNDFNARRPSKSFSSFSDYHASRAPQEPVYQYALPGQTDAQLHSTPTAYDQHADQMAAYGSGSNFQTGGTYAATEPSYPEYESAKFPEISTYEPQKGTSGTQVYVYLKSTSNMLDPSPLIVSLMFAKRRVPASITLLKTQMNDGWYNYIVSGYAPSFSEIESSNTLVSLRLQLQEATGLDAGLIDVGHWQYQDGRQLELRPSPEITRKRKNTLDPQEASTSTKRTSSTAVPDYDSYPYASNSMANYPQTLQSIDWSSMQRKLTPYGRSQSQQSLQDNSTSLGVDGLSGGFPDSKSLMRPPLTQSSSYGTSYVTSHQSGRSPRTNPTPSFHMPSLVSPSPANPPLVRSSTLQQPSGTASTSTTSSTDGPFNPYTMYPNRAIIKIRGGDLNSMQDNWTAEERAVKRRLVRFQGEQDGSTINTYFKAVKPDDRPSSHETRERRVSCIYWEERDEYFVTSVDTIALLETLVGARFTVEEKNRIRRNLETHHPLTVSKAKPDTESFFKVIMGLPNPKPRNIEKDVKVFPWPILGQALRKVISKYSASPASTAGPLSTSRSPKYGGAPSDTSSDRCTHLSSRSSTGSSAYASTINSLTLSPSTASHGLSTQYPQASPLPTSVPGPSRSYTAPTLAGQHSHDDGRSLLGTNYTISTSDLPAAYAAYTSPASDRRRSSDGRNDTFGSSHYSARPRASTSFLDMYQATQDPSSDYALSQLPSAAQVPRPSWDLAFAPGPFNHETPQGMQFRLSGRQNSHTSQYPQATADVSTSQSSIH